MSIDVSIIPVYCTIGSSWKDRDNEEGILLHVQHMNYFTWHIESTIR